MLNERKPNAKYYILYDSLYVIPRKDDCIETENGQLATWDWV